MKLKLEVALSGVAIAVLSSMTSVYAAPVYEIQNIIEKTDEYNPSGYPDVDGTLPGTRNGYGTGVNANMEMIGLSQGRKKLSDDDIEDGGIIDEEDGIAPAEQIRYSIFEPILANNFSFFAEQNATPTPWAPEFLKINGQTSRADDGDTSANAANSPSPNNSVDVSLFALNNAGVKVGSMSAPQKTMDYVGTDTEQKFWYYRDYEERGVAVNTDGTQVELLPPYTQYVKDDDVVSLGGRSIGAEINESGLVVGYASTALSKFGTERVDVCLSTNNTLPLDICVQREQFPDLNGVRNIQYQMRAYVWQLNADNTAVETSEELPFGLDPTGSDFVFTSQGLGVNAAGTVVGRSNVYRYGDTDNLRNDAAYWEKDAHGKYQYKWVPVRDDDVLNSIAFDINDSGILVGSFKSYLSGYVRDKFFYYDTTTPDTPIVIPNDFGTSTSDLSSKPKSINTHGQVVGYIETSYDKELPRPKEAFYFDMKANEGKGEFVNLNNQLTCESKGYEKDANGEWKRQSIIVKDGTGTELSYNADFTLVDAVSISDDGTIVGTVFVRKPRYKFDADGELILGENGLPLFELNGFGQPLTSYLPRSVVLTPATGATACTAIDDDDANAPYERKGASMWWALALTPLLWLRRKSLTRQSLSL
ncbi:DUF3466 family protein [Shewanella sp. NIFS-20-20]|uniref:DUF3466 family protein n=1 Tax=Shewanella sp. NIFS-20-20 TaxID=2853806 RepID=UPI001C448EB3|nr:DUF3466 family protein [Shewanella sp. NIFS-20-20]MBV7317488.1 DUF3466 family protein [Shewanella sp. NIFS-20-20]